MEILDDTTREGFSATRRENLPHLFGFGYCQTTRVWLH